jgi:hypothetical protein
MEKSDDCDDDGVRTGLDEAIGDDCGLEKLLCDARGAPCGWDLYAAKLYAGGR